MADPTTNDLPALLELERRIAAGEVTLTPEQQKRMTSKLQVYAQQGLYKPKAGFTIGGLPIRDIKDNERNQLKEVFDTFDAQRDLISNFRSDYAGAPIVGKLENAAQSINTDIGTPGQSLWWKKFNLYDSLERNKLFGAALTATEKGSWEATTVGPGDDPKIVQDKILTRYTLARTALARLSGTLEAGGVAPEILQAAGLSPEIRQEINRPKTNIITIGGREFSFSSPAGASPEEIQQMAQEEARKQGDTRGVRVDPLVRSAASERDTFGGAADAFVRGMADTLTVGADNKIVSALNAVAPLDRLSGRDVKSIWDGASLSDAYQYNLATENATDALDEQVNPLARTGGQITGGVLGFNKINTLANTLPRALAVDGGLGVLYGVNTASDKTNNANEIVVEGLKTGAASAIGGQAGRLVTSGASKVATGAKDAATDLLRSKGITLTPGQILGGATETIENALTSVPFVKDVINRRRGESVEDFNRAIMNDALAPIGEKGPKDIGEKGVLYLQEKVGGAFKKALEGVTLNADDAYKAEINAAIAAGKELPESLRDVFDTMVKKRVNQLFKKGNDGTTYLDGDSFQAVLEGINKDVSEVYKSTSFTQKDLFDEAATRVEDAVLNLAKRQSPGTAEALDAANSAYRNKSIVQKAVLAGQNNGGVFTPAQLGRASTANSVKYVGENAAAAGNRPFFDLQRAAQDNLPPVLPDSGTALRAAIVNGVGLSGVAGGGYYAADQGLIDPSTAMTIGALALPFTRTGNKAMNKVLVDRPAWLRDAGEAISSTAKSSPLGATFGGVLAAPEPEQKAVYVDPQTGILFDKDGKPVGSKK